MAEQDKPVEGRTFSTTSEEQTQINNWVKEHAQTCLILSNKATQNWLGSSIHYIFTPCSFCTSIRIKCNCGAEFEVPSDPDSL
jgi:hypothetical protein